MSNPNNNAIAILSFTRLSCYHYLLRMSMMMAWMVAAGRTDAFSSPPIVSCRARRGGLAATATTQQQQQRQRRRSTLLLMSASNNESDSSAAEDDDTIGPSETAIIATTTTTTNATATNDDDAPAVVVLSTEGLDRVFDAVDKDGSGSIDFEEYNLHLSTAGYSGDAILESFVEIDRDGNGEISREELHSALLSNLKRKEGGTTKKKGKEGEGEDIITMDMDDCPMGYWLDSVHQSCQPLGPLGKMSQRLETYGPLKKVYGTITNIFGMDTKSLRRRGVPFLLTYSILSNLNGALSLTVAWYMTVKRTGLSPLVPGQKKSLLASYAMIYGVLQLLKPFRVAAAIAMSKLSAEYLDMTQERFHCSRNVAIGCQYAMGQIMMGVTFYVGVTVVSLITGVPIWG